MTPNRSNPNTADPCPDSRPEARLVSRPASARDGSIAGILSQAPDLRIPADFAARVGRRATAQPEPRAARLNGWGPRLALGSGALLTLALFALAPHAAPSLTSPRFDAELVVLAELSTLLLFAPRLLRRD